MVYRIDMKSFKQHIFEKLRVDVRNTTKHTLFPKTKNELKHMIEDEISKHGNECSLNHIDVSEITDMSSLFFESYFNGDISEWDVSNVENMNFMFYKSKFNGDISNWNVSRVRNMTRMFYKSKFNGDLSKWKVPRGRYMKNVFDDSPLEGKEPDWYKAYMKPINS